jgi:hypothetical protein
MTRYYDFEVQEAVIFLGVINRVVVPQILSNVTGEVASQKVKWVCALPVRF